MKSAHDPLRAEQYRERAGRAGRFRMHRRNAAQFRVDLGDKRSELELFRELSGVEISNRARLDLRRVDLCIIDRFLAGLDDQMPDGFAFLFQVPLKVGASTAENVNVVHSSINLVNHHSLSSLARLFVAESAILFGEQITNRPSIGRALERLDKLLKARREKVVAQLPIMLDSGRSDVVLKKTAPSLPDLFVHHAVNMVKMDRLECLEKLVSGMEESSLLFR